MTETRSLGTQRSGVSKTWGLLVEAASGQKLDAYVRDHVTGPLGMMDTGFVITPKQRTRQASVHQRQPDSSLQPQPLEMPFTPEF